MKLLGFLNLGNTCYLNVVVSSFIYDPKFRQIINERIKKNEFMENLLDIISNTEILENHENKYQINIKTYSLKNFIDSFKLEKPWFEVFNQNDSHEFLMYFMDLISKYSIIKTEIEPVIKVSVRNAQKDAPGVADTTWLKFLKDNNSKFSRIYYGQLKTTVKCCNCKHLSISFNEFNSINLDLPENNLTNNNEITLSDLFGNYLKSEIFNDPKNLFFCDNCKEYSVSTKKYSLYRLPEKLIIILNRYSSDGMKKNISVSFPLNDLKIKEKCSLKTYDYSLCSIINHYGIHRGGHYNCLNKINNNWFLIDDVNFKIINFNDNTDLKNRESYILIYSKELIII